MASSSKKKLDPIHSKGKDPGKGKPHTSPVLYVFSVIILAVIVITFIGAPVVDTVGGAGRIVFGYFKNEPIEYVPGNYFSRQKDLIADQLRSRGDQQLNFETQVYQVWRGAFHRTVFHTAIVTLMNESGVQISENLVDEQLAAHPAFMENGEFSETRFRQTPLSERYAIRRMVRENIHFQRYLADLGTIPLSTPEAEFLKAIASPERRFKYILLPFTAYPDSEVVKYGEENEAKFKRGRFSSITITTGKRDAEGVFARLQNQEITFEDAARSFSKDPFAEKGGDLGLRYAYELDIMIRNPEDTAKIMSMQAGEIAGPVEAADGWIILRIDETPTTPQFTDPELISTIRSYMMSLERGRIEDYLLSEAKRFKAEVQPSNFETAAIVRGFQVKETDYFPINYGNSIFLKPVTRTDSVLMAAAFRESFFETAFALKPNEISDPVVLGEGIVLLKMLNERTAPEAELQMLDIYLPFIAQRFTEENLQQFIFGSEYFRDDFHSVFVRYFLPRQ